MNDLERKYWLSYQKQLPRGFEEYWDRIDKILNSDKPNETFKIMTLNDILRSAGIWGEIFVARGIQAQQESFKQRLIMAVRSFDDFSADNDPYKEHDFWSVALDGHKSYFKIDYYDKNRQFGSEEPSNPSVTSRVMTIMLAEEY